MRKKDLWIIGSALALALILSVSIFVTQTVPTGAWGLSFPQPGKTPTAPASADTMRQYDAAFLGNTDEKVLYLTFDAGYENGHTETILDTLKKHDVKAAFFLVGNYLQKNADLVRRMVEEGHIVGNHTMSHPNMSAISDADAFRSELEGLETLFTDITGKELPKYYRPPRGVYSEQNLQMAKDLGYKTVFWSLAYADWDNDNQPAEDAAIQRLLDRTHNGAVILLHSTSKTNAAILDRLLSKWEEMGYRFETIDTLF